MEDREEGIMRTGSYLLEAYFQLAKGLILPNMDIFSQPCYKMCVYAVCALSLRCVRCFLTPWTVARQAPLSMGILQPRILEWVVISFSRESSRPRTLRTDCLPPELPGKPILQDRYYYSYVFLHFTPLSAMDMS